VKIRRTDRFKKDYQELPANIQQRVDQKLRFLLGDPRHPSLRAHKVQGVEGLWEFSVTMNGSMSNCV
jgi:mRNA-degrading endonuclease RelE of RelBE toxin-antitoxin system